jgi:hypothetical protein
LRKRLDDPEEKVVLRSGSTARLEQLGMSADWGGADNKVALR